MLYLPSCDLRTQIVYVLHMNGQLEEFYLCLTDALLDFWRRDYHMDDEHPIGNKIDLYAEDKNEDRRWIDGNSVGRRDHLMCTAIFAAQTAAEEYMYSGEIDDREAFDAEIQTGKRLINAECERLHITERMTEFYLSGVDQIAERLRPKTKKREERQIA